MRSRRMESCTNDRMIDVARIGTNRMRVDFFSFTHTTRTSSYASKQEQEEEKTSFLLLRKIFSASNELKAKKFVLALGATDTEITQLSHCLAHIQAIVIEFEMRIRVLNDAGGRHVLAARICQLCILTTHTASSGLCPKLHFS